MQYTIIGIFSERTNAEDAINDLQDQGFNAKDMSIIMRDRGEAKTLAQNTGTDVAGGTITGLTTGAVVGGLAGLVGSFVIPGLGAFLIGGPISAALGLTGAAAATASGAVTGAVAGGILGAIMGLGVPREDAQVYEESINNGGILIAVPATEETYEKAREILEAYDATNVRTLNLASPRTEVQKDDANDYPPLTAQHYQRSYAVVGAKGGRKSKRTKRKTA